MSFKPVDFKIYDYPMDWNRGRRSVDRYALHWGKARHEVTLVGDRFVQMNPRPKNVRDALLYPSPFDLIRFHVRLYQKLLEIGSGVRSSGKERELIGRELVGYAALIRGALEVYVSSEVLEGLDRAIGQDAAEKDQRSQGMEQKQREALVRLHQFYSACSHRGTVAFDGEHYWRVRDNGSQDNRVLLEWFEAMQLQDTPAQYTSLYNPPQLEPRHLRQIDRYIKSLPDGFVRVTQVREIWL